MFVGHCGPGFVAKRFEDSIPLWVLFIDAQWLDIVWCTLVLLGINKVQILGGYAQMDPYYMPYDHALDAALLWSLAAGLAYWVWRRADGRPAGRSASWSNRFFSLDTRLHNDISPNCRCLAMLSKSGPDFGGTREFRSWLRSRCCLVESTFTCVVQNRSPQADDGS